MTAKTEDLRIGLELDMHMDETSRAGRAGRRHPRKRTRRRRDETVAESPPRAGPQAQRAEAPVQCDQSNTNRTGTSPPSRVRVASVSGLRRGPGRGSCLARRGAARPGGAGAGVPGVSRLPRQSQSHINKSPKRPPGTSTEPHPPLDHDRPGHERAHEATPRRSTWSTVLELHSGGRGEWQRWDESTCVLSHHLATSQGWL